MYDDTQIVSRYRMELDLTSAKIETLHIPASIHISSMEESDLDILASLEIEGYRNTEEFSLRPELQSPEACRAFLEKMLSGKIGRFLRNLSFKVMEKETLCGAIYTFEHESHAYIADIVIAPNYRGRGLGKMLLTYALEQYQRAGYSQVGLAVTATNTATICLYERFGFRIEKTFTINTRS